MANKSANLKDSTTIRQFLNANLADPTTEKTGMHLEITLPDATGSNPTLTQVYDVNVIWDGGEYYIAYKKADTETTIHMNILDNVMPIQLVVDLKSPSAT